MQHLRQKSLGGELWQRTDGRTLLCRPGWGPLVHLKTRYCPLPSLSSTHPYLTRASPLSGPPLSSQLASQNREWWVLLGQPPPHPQPMLTGKEDTVIAVSPETGFGAHRSDL